jgi:hypothetical protein
MVGTIIEEIVINGETIRLEHADIPIKNVELDENNPRLRYKRAKDDKKPLDELLRHLPDAPKLRRDIEYNGGCRERIIVFPMAGGKFKAAEGNRRTVAVRDLHAKHPNEARWKTIPARVLPPDMDPKKLAILLSDLHVMNKVRWDAHEKAGHIYHMNKTLRIPLDEIAVTLHASKTTVSRFLNAYAFMQERFLTIDDGKYREEGERTWSFFDELYRSKELRQCLLEDDSFGDRFCRWVGEGRLFKGEQVRKLIKILTHPEARKVFEDGPVKSAFDNAQRIIETKDPEEGSEFFKLLAKVRESCTSAAQVKEILRIRSDVVARKRLLDTYEALVDFMHLADVEVPTDMEEAA